MANASATSSDWSALLKINGTEPLLQGIPLAMREQADIRIQSLPRKTILLDPPEYPALRLRTQDAMLWQDDVSKEINAL